MKSYSQQPFPVIRQTKDEGATDSCFTFICASIIVKEMIVAELYSNLDRYTVSLIPAFWMFVKSDRKQYIHHFPQNGCMDRKNVVN